MDHFQTGTASLIPKEVPFSQVPLREKLHAAKDIGLAALPNILTMIAAAFKDIISLYFVGHLNNPLLFAAAGFSTTWINAFGSAPIFGLAAGFSTIASQAYGAQNYKKFGLFFQKSLAVGALLFMGISLILWFTRYELLAAGFDDELASEIGSFVQCLILDIFLCMLSELTRFYLVSQNIFYIPAYVLIIATVLHIWWCHLFVNILNLELTGIAVARTITDGTIIALLYLYIRIQNPCPESWFPWTRECFDRILEFGKQLLSFGSSIYIEWMAFEMTTIVIGFFGNNTVLGGHAAAMNYMYANSSTSIGLMIGMTIYVGNAAGEGSVIKAQKYAYVGVMTNFIVVTMLDLFLLLSRENIAVFYTDEENVKNYTVKFLTFYCFGMHADLCCNCFAYALRTLGQEKFVLKGFIISYYGVGVTCSIVGGIFLGFGAIGVWMSLLAGCYIMLMWNTSKFLKLDWSQEVATISKEMKTARKGSNNFEEYELM